MILIGLQWIKDSVNSMKNQEKQKTSHLLKGLTNDRLKKQKQLE